MNKNKYEVISNLPLESIVAGMNKVHPQSKFSNGASYKQIAKEYFDLCVMELLNNISYQNTISEVSLKNIKSKFNYRYNKTHYWWDYLFTNYPLWLEKEKGYSVSNSVKQLTQIECMVPITDIMHYRLQSDFGDYYRSTILPDNRVYTDIDIKSLTVYRTVCSKEQKWDKVAKCQDILDQQQAGVLISNAEIKQNVFGQSRMYMTGANNMQYMNKTVREAALGECYKYDINSSVFSYMMDVIKTEYPGLRVPCMMMLVDSKDYCRKLLATDCLTETLATPEHKLNIIKSSLTALSFGSNPANYKSGIANYIWHKADRQRFAEHPFVKGIMLEIKEYQNIIRSLFPKSEYPGVKLVTLCSNHYQSMEAYAMSNAIKELKNADVMLVVHDCIYTKRRIDLMYATVLLQDVLGPYARFERKHILGWQDRSRWAHNEQEILDHKNRIFHEELMARNQHETSS